MASERERILQAAQKYVDRKRYDRAIEEYQKIIKKDPKDARTLLKVGDLQARMQAYADAIATYDRVGQHYAAQGFALKAIAVYKQVRELIKKHAPDLTDRYSHITPKLAEIYTQLGLTGDALAAWDEVATRHQRAGRDREAIAVFEKMVDLDNSNPLPRLRLAEACCRVQELDRAIDSFWSSAELLLKLNRRDDALKVIDRILHFRQDPRYARAAAEIYLQKGTREDGLQALAKLQICFQANPKDLDTLALLAQAFTVIQAESKALEVYKEMARVAREQGQMEVHQQLMVHLRSVAPNDEQVQSLESLPPVTNASHPPNGVSGAPQSSWAPQPWSISPEPVSDADVEYVSDDEILSASVSDGHAEVLVDEEADVAEEVVAPAAAAEFDTTGHIRKALVDAESFRRLRLYSKAIEALTIALELDPRAIQVRSELRKILEEAGNPEAASTEAVNVASLHLEHGDHESAKAALYDALQLVPDNADAIELLAHLGERPPTGWDIQTQQHNLPINEGYDPQGPLPSYDLEEISAAHAMGEGALDDPFGDVSDRPLPSFPLGGEAEYADEPVASPQHGYDAQAYGQAPGYIGQGYGAQHPYNPPYQPAYTPQYQQSYHPQYGQPYDARQQQGYGQGEDAPAGYPAVAPDATSTEAIEEALEEAEFFAARGLYDDARAILTDQLTRTPNHPLLVERLREIDRALSPSGESGTIERSRLNGPRQRQKAFNIAVSLDALDALDGSARGSPVGRRVSARSDDIDVDQVFQQFKAGVRQQVAEGDASTHYDLGVAYKEMMLLPDAINEFELAARDPDRECPCFAMIGMIHLEQGQLDEAAIAYKRALAAERRTIDQEMSLYYDLGNVMEMKQLPEEALYYFKLISRRDPNFRDIKDRIAELERNGSRRTSGTRSVEDEDEFDAVFDDLFESK